MQSTIVVFGVTIIIILAPGALYWITRLMASAFFHEKLRYHNTLMDSIQPRGENVNDHASENK